MSSQGYVTRGKSATAITYRASATADTTTTSGTDALVNSMTLTPAAGTYLTSFSSSMTSNAAGAAISASYYIGGVQRAESLRKISPLDGGTLSVGSARAIMDITDVISVNGSQAIEVRWSTSGGTATCHPRILNAVKI